MSLFIVVNTSLTEKKCGEFKFEIESAFGEKGLIAFNSSFVESNTDDLPIVLTNLETLICVTTLNTTILERPELAQL